MVTPIAPVRRPLDLDVHDDDEVRRWLAETLHAQILAKGTPIPSFYLLCDGHVETLVWSDVLEADPGADFGATWRRLVSRRDVERRIAVFRLEHEGGLLEVCSFEERWEDDAPSGWWFAHRPFAVVEGLGRLLGDGWRQYQGDGPPPEPFAGLFLVRGPAAQLAPARPPAPKVWLQSGEAPAGIALPSSALGMAEVTRDEVVGSLQRGDGLRHLLVFLLRGRTWEKWLLGDDLPAGSDELVRWICGRLAQPDGVATAEAVVMELDGVLERAVRVVAERGGERVEGALVLAPKEDAPCGVVPVNWRWRSQTVGEGDGWIGVAPMMSGDLVTTFEGYGRPK